MKRPAVLGLVLAVVFGVVAVVMLQFMPTPLKDADYLVVGSVATLISLVVLFFMMVASKPGVFLKRRRKTPK